MPLIRDGKVLFYHPLNSDTEYIKSFDWTRSANCVFDTGIIVSGLTSDTTANVSITGSVGGGGYDDLENAQHFAVAFWSSGLYGDTIKDDTVEIGFGNTDISDGNGARFFMSETAGVPYVRLIKCGASGPAKEVPIFPTSNGWHFTVIDFSLQGSTWQYLISINGSGWQNIGSGGNADLPDSDNNCRIELDLESTSYKVILDEIVIWKDLDEFTEEELSNLYELFNTHGQPMDQYGNVFGIQSDDNIDCFINGHSQTSSNIALYIPCQKEIESIPLFINGFISISGNTDLYINGIPPTESSSIDLYLLAPNPVSGNTNNFICGHQSSYSSIDQYVYGHSEISGNVTLYMSGILGASTDLYIVGPLLLNNNINHFMHGHLPISGNCTLFVQGCPQSIEAFVAVSRNNPSENIDLFVCGAPSGENDLFYINDTITLFIQNSRGIVSTDSTWPSFIKVEDAFIISYSGIWPSFAKVGNTSNNNINLHINGHASGDAPHGTLITNTKTLLINGQFTQEDDESLLSDGYLVLNQEIFAFTKVHFGWNNTTDLYIYGETVIIPPSAYIDLSIFGIIDNIFDSINLYTLGNNNISGNCNLFLFGIQDIKSNDVPLYIEVTNIGFFNRSNTLYAHGF